MAARQMTLDARKPTGSEAEGDGGHLVPETVLEQIVRASTEPNPYRRMFPAIYSNVKMTRRLRLRMLWYGSRWPLVISALRNRHDCREDDW